MNEEFKNTVFAALLKNGEFKKGINKVTKPIFEELVEKALNQLEAKLDNPATIEELVSAKITVIRIASEENGFVVKICKATGQGLFADMMAMQLSAMVEALEPFTQNALQAIAEYGISEKDVWAKFEMPKDLLKKCIAKTATLRDILTESPATIFKNT